MVRSPALPAMDDAPTWNTLKKYMENKPDPSFPSFDVKIHDLNEELRSNQVCQAFQVADDKILNFCRTMDDTFVQKIIPIEVTNASVDVDTNRLMMTMCGTGKKKKKFFHKL